jgi:hypothetical protein
MTTFEPLDPDFQSGDGKSNGFEIFRKVFQTCVLVGIVPAHPPETENFIFSKILKISIVTSNRRKMSERCRFRGKF